MIRQAIASQDREEISKFLDRAILLHRHLDWRPVMDWINDSPFLLDINDHGINALLSNAPDPENIAWIHCFAVKEIRDYPKVWQSILNTSREILQPGNNLICAVGLNNWFIELLKISGFIHKQEIVVLSWHGVIPQHLPMSKDILIRPMKPEDLEEVAKIDQAAFEPMWRFSRNALELAFNQSAYCNVADLNGRIIAYHLFTLNHYAAHLARLAVLPDFSRNNIGYSLVLSAMKDFHQRGITQITVNTQDDNKASLSLYEKLGFKRSSDSFPIYTQPA